MSVIGTGAGDASTVRSANSPGARVKHEERRGKWDQVRIPRSVLGNSGLAPFGYLAESGGLMSEEWLRTRLVDLAAMRRDECPTSDPSTITMSQSDLAKMVGVSRQTLSGPLDRLETRCLMKVGYRSIRVLG